MKRTLVLAAALAAALPFSALAHKAWLQPSQTVIAGNNPWITVDAAVSNDLFYFNHVPLRLDNLVITAPDGTTVQPQNASTGKFRSVFDVELTQQGTYRLATINNGLSATWDEDGKPKRWRGTAATFASEVPKKAKNLKVSQSVGRVETFVTNGTPNDTALKPTKQGIEMVALAIPTTWSPASPRPSACWSMASRAPVWRSRSPAAARAIATPRKRSRSPPTRRASSPSPGPRPACTGWKPAQRTGKCPSSRPRPAA